MGRIWATSAAILAVLIAAAAPAWAADVRVRVLGVRSGEGRVLVALCSPATFLGRSCEAMGSAQATPGTTEVVIRDVPPGVYAAQAVHDENGNRDLDRNRIGMPVEGLGFSRDAPLRMGPPRFDDAAFEVSGGGAMLIFGIRYF